MAGPLDQIWGLGGYLQGQRNTQEQNQANQQQSLAQVQQLHAIGQLVQQAQAQKLAEEKQKQAAAMAPLQRAQLIAQVQKLQTEAAAGQRENQFYSPENQAKYTIPGMPAQPPIASPPDELGGGPSRPELPAVPPSMNVDAFRRDAAMLSPKGMEIYSAHLAAQDQAKATRDAAVLARKDALDTKLYDIQVRSQDRNLSIESREQLARDAIQARREQAQLLSSLRQPPAPQMITNADGVFQVDRTGNAKPVVGPDGKPITGKTTADRTIPAPIAKAFMENNAAVRKIDRAIDALDAYPAGVGLSNYWGDTIRQRSNPKGVEVRALIADIGSLKIHDRSGAAVTAAETPRLKPFIPNVTDTPDTIRKKLEQFRTEYEGIQNDLQITYSPDQGYKPLPSAGRPPLESFQR
jgi:hypothetical protein